MKRADATGQSLSERLRDLLERMPRPYEEDRRYSKREQDQLLADVALVDEAATLLAASETRAPLAWAVESSHSGDVNVLEIFDDERVAKLHAENNGGIVHPLYKAARVSATRTPPLLAPKDANGKRPRLFYFEEAESCWCPADGYELAVENIIDVESFLSDGDVIAIEFKRQDMTDEEHAAIPEG